jgi:flagellar biosynthesis/type III secretory pathway protein FliH
MNRAAYILLSLAFAASGCDDQIAESRLKGYEEGFDEGRERGKNEGRSEAIECVRKEGGAAEDAAERCR